MTRRGAVLLGVLPLVGCLDRMLEAPYLLAPGLGEARSVGPGLDGRLLVASTTGVFAVDGEGRVEALAAQAAEAVSAHPGRVYVLRDGRVDVHVGTGAMLGSPVDAFHVPGAVDIVAGYEGLVVLHPDRLEAHVGKERLPLARGLRSARSVALGPDGGYLVVTATTLLRVAEGVVTTLAEGLTDARAAATDAKGRVYVVQGDPPELFRVDATGPTSIAKWLGDARDLHFGIGATLPPENLYVANGVGTLDYVRPP